MVGVIEGSQAIERVCTRLGLPYSLRKEQTEIIARLMNKENVFGLLPTGFGKSDCFALLPLVLDEINPQKKHMVVVISPLRSLMIDLKARYSNLGITVSAILTIAEMDKAEIKGLEQGEFSLVLTSPEAILNAPWWEMLKTWRPQLCCLAIDEAHCSTTWGKDFRHEYTRIAEVRTQCPDVPILALTATATQDMMSEILTLLHLKEDDVKILAVLPNRPNIHLTLQKVGENMSALNWVIETIRDMGNASPKTLIYARTIDQVVKIYGHLMKRLGTYAWLNNSKSSKHPRIEMFHGSTDSVKQKQIVERFTSSSTIKTVVATVAFGMGVDVPDVRNVLHWGPSSSVLNYWQEVGRCARDGAPGKAFLYLPPRSVHPRQIPEKMVNFVKDLQSSQTCLRKAILKQLFVKGMSEDELENCSSCSNSCCNNCEI